ncbi:transcription factor kapc [Fusarium sporotrichioides]|uniref:Putative transcription factor kapC n=1 Tax=Fusarium sporotrichioides TaxID=5514 RepID=A0A395RYN2_FUSSP|nr:transcription factor kapc [Fusarium sporotrichioides]
MQNSSASGANNQEQHLRAQLELLKSHDATASPSTASPAPRDTRHQPLQPAPARPSNGFDHSHNPQDQPRAIAAKGEVEAHIHPDLRARANNAPTATMMPIVPPSGHSPGASAGPSTAPITSVPPPHMSPDDHGDGRSKAKRELSQSKRAAQNRAAQRAFRQRKEGYIKKLEQQVREYMDMEQSFKSLQSDNHALREYIVHLQSRLFDVTGEYPPPPHNVDIAQPAQQPSAPAPAPPSATAPAPAPIVSAPPEPAPSNSAAGTPLEAVAQAVAGLAAQEQIERQQYPTAHE